MRSHEWQHHGGAKWEFRESPKSFELILWKMKENTILTSACKIAPDSWLKYSNCPSLMQSVQYFKMMKYCTALSVWYCSRTRHEGLRRVLPLPHCHSVCSSPDVCGPQQRTQPSDASSACSYQRALEVYNPPRWWVISSSGPLFHRLTTELI